MREPTTQPLKFLSEFPGEKNCLVCRGGGEGGRFGGQTGPCLDNLYHNIHTPVKENKYLTL